MIRRAAAKAVRAPLVTAILWGLVLVQLVLFESASAAAPQVSDDEPIPHPTTITAEEPMDSRFSGKPWSVDVSVGTPTTRTGALSVGTTLELAPHVAVVGTVGLSSAGWRASLMPSFVHRVQENMRLRAGAGVSAGPDCQSGWYLTDLMGICSDDHGVGLRSPLALSGQAEVSWEYRAANGWHARPYLGVSHILNPDSFSCELKEGAHDDDCYLGPDNLKQGRVYGGVAFGVAF